MAGKTLNLVTRNHNFMWNVGILVLLGLTVNLHGMDTNVYREDLELVWESPVNDIQKLMVCQVTEMDPPCIGAIGEGQTIHLFSPNGKETKSILLSIKPTKVQFGDVLGTGEFQFINTNPLSNRLDIFNLEGNPMGKLVTHGRIKDILVNDFNEDGVDELLLGIRTAPGLIFFRYPDQILWEKTNIGEVNRVQTALIKREKTFFVLSNNGYIESFNITGNFIKRYSAPAYITDFNVITEDGIFQGLIALGEEPGRRQNKLYFFDHKGFIKWEKTFPSPRNDGIRMLAVGDIMGTWENAFVLVSGKRDLVIIDTQGNLRILKHFPGTIRDLMLVDLNNDKQVEIVLAVPGKGLMVLKYVDMVSPFTSDDKPMELATAFQESPTFYWTALNYLEMGNRLFRRDNLESALDAFQKSIILNPDTAISYANVAVTLIGLERELEAEFFCQKSMDLDPELPDPVAYLGLVQFVRGNLDRSISLNLKAALLGKPGLHLSPYSIMDNGSIHYNLACAYALKGNSKLALFQLKKALRLNEKLRENVSQDVDLQILFNNPEFKKLLDVY